MAKTYNAVITSLNEGMRFQGVSRDNLVMEMDSRPIDEQASGPSPVELVLHALAGCTAMDVLAMLRKRRVEIEHFEVAIEALRRDEHPRIFTDIALTYRVKAEQVTVSEVEMAANLSMTKYCAVSAMIKPLAHVTWKCEIIE